MKRFWLILLSLGLIMAFSASAFAVDVKVSGEYYVAGLYLNKTNVMIEATDAGTILSDPAQHSFIRDCASEQILLFLRVLNWLPVLTLWKESGVAREALPATNLMQPQIPQVTRSGK